MIEKLHDLLKGKPRLLILGFGREGRSTFRLLRKHFPFYLLSIADQNTGIAELPELKDDSNVKLFLGENYLDAISQNDLIIKSPGISLNSKQIEKTKIITSQTDIFLGHYAKQTVGVTGTKGKSTTVSLIYHILKNNEKSAVLIGNIGIPPFDKLDEIEENTTIVFEMSAHQLEYLHHSPHIAVLLNLFPEHLDHFKDLEHYYSSKINIGKFQNENDFLITEESLTTYLPKIISKIQFFVRTQDLSASILNKKIVFADGNIQQEIHLKKNPLIGEHNLNNLRAAMLAVHKLGICFEDSYKCLASFKALPHRLEYVGNFGGIDFYNDSISTVPESAIAAIKSIKGIDILILGGFDRGIDYSNLVEFISESNIKNLIFLGRAGDKMMSLLPNKIEERKNIFKVNDLDEAFRVIRQCAKDGSVCMLSPAAASYDQFHNFEHRGDVFRELANQFS